MTRSTKAIRTCAEWLAFCIRIGWPRRDLDALERIWWDCHDDFGRLRALKDPTP